MLITALVRVLVSACLFGAAVRVGVLVRVQFAGQCACQGAVCVLNVTGSAGLALFSVLSGRSGYVRVLWGLLRLVKGCCFGSGKCCLRS